MSFVTLVVRPGHIRRLVTNDRNRTRSTESHPRPPSREEVGRIDHRRLDGPKRRTEVRVPTLSYICIVMSRRTTTIYRQQGAGAYRPDRTGRRGREVLGCSFYNSRPSNRRRLFSRLKEDYLSVCTVSLTNQ